MKRLLATVAAVSVIGLPLASVSFAPAADAITNPAQNPHPITVKGDDGNTYTDGADTLPGYDDEACTYIPGAWFDFDNNRVHYADGQSIAWTEWDRATGYAEWKAKHDKPTQTASAKPTSKPTAKASSKPSSKPTSGAGTGTGTKTAGHPTPTAAASTSASTDATTVAPTATATASATSTPTAASTEAAQATQAPAAGATTSTEAGATVTDASPSATTTDAQLADVAADTSGSSISGLAIIGGLVAVAVLLLGGNAVYRRSRKESVQ